MAIDRADGRNRAAIDGEKRAVQGIRQTLLVGIAERRHDLEVKPGAKALALAGKDDGAGARVTCHALEGRGDLLRGLDAHRVRRRLLQGDGGDRPILARGDPGQLSVL
jgi:hypothetical protein